MRHMLKMIVMAEDIIGDLRVLRDTAWVALCA